MIISLLTCLRSSLSAEGECICRETWGLLSLIKWSWALMCWKWSFGICRRELVSAGCDCTDAFEPCKKQKRQKCDNFTGGLRSCLSDLSEKTAPFHLGPDRHVKTAEFSSQLSMIGKRLPPTNKSFQNCLLFHFSWHFPLIQLRLAPVKNRRSGTRNSSGLAISTSLL